MIEIRQTGDCTNRHDPFTTGHADVRTSSQASTMVPWHGRQTMEIEDDSDPEDDA
jgi:hypothetical protein